MRTGRSVAVVFLVALAAAAPAPAVVDPSSAAVQVAMRAHGLYPGAIDGIAGPLTNRAVRKFQRRHRLAVDGVPGPRTRAKLGRLGRPDYGRRVIRHGMVGWDVSVLQFRLRIGGVRTGTIDGMFGPMTLGAVRRFQRRAGLAADGLVGPMTRRALAQGRAAAPRRASRPSVPYLTHDQVRARLIRQATRYGVSPELVRAVAWIESGFQTNVVSPAGAWGVMQVIPPTWRFVERVLLGKRIPHTVWGNIHVGVIYLRHLLRLWGGNTRLAVASYYQGARAVRRHGLYGETRVYVRAVLSLYRSI
jgi:peptidoglycan hydrolase-like protein with peptidoglycan-binding domain